MAVMALGAAAHAPWTAEATAQAPVNCRCENVLSTNCDGSPSTQPIVVNGGDLAGRVNALGAPKADGMIDQFDVVRLIEIFYQGGYDPCADLDNSGTINLEPTTIGGVEYCGDLVLMERLFGPCEAVCRNSPGTNDCTTPVIDGTPGCTDPECCSLVCSIDELCCDFGGTGWDFQCAQLADTACGSTGGNCLLPRSDAGCLSSSCEALVCAEDPLCCVLAWDQACADLAGLLCLDILCQENQAITCAVSVCGSDNQTLGSCSLPHSTGGCSDPTCCALVCQADPSCCEISWDTSCAKAASLTCASASSTCGGASDNPNCFAPTLDVLSPARGCQDFDCCSTVCQFDPYCCLIAWDQNCANDALEVCARSANCGEIGTGSCVQAPEKGAAPPVIPGGCTDVSCCNLICSSDPSCCEVEWDESCRETARNLCTNCGESSAGGCFDLTNNSPACNNQECCDEVGAIDEYCLLVLWDQQCVSLAQSVCEPLTSVCGESNTRGCFVSNNVGGCRDVSCCTEVCETFDPYCCEVAWDAICSTTALSVPSCISGNNFNSFGPCLEVHGGKGCNVPACAAAVCALPSAIAADCCEVLWDQTCVDLAEVLCYDLLVCPGEGPCNQQHGGVGCEDPFCCAAVCELDPICCAGEWDSTCVGLANQYCNAANKPFCPCAGSCFEPRPIDINDPDAPQPGCEDASCCAAVCELDPQCCAEDGIWDASCVALAEQYCCRGIFCGDFCAGSCLVPSETPNCDDPACCAAVCTIDPYCCETRWDSGCVATAAERCTSGCGIPTSGSCFIGKLGTGCDDPDCCTTVCELDTYCCQVAWDTTCANMASENCELPDCGDYATGDCCLINGSPSCRDATCCNAVCNEDPFCCEGAWDEFCVFLARENETACPSCSAECGSPCAGECCSANGTPACDDAACCDAVCQLDSFCCDSQWDVFCAQQARATCNYNGENGTNPALDACPAPKCGDPGLGDCCLPHGTPLCEDEQCCDAVGLIDSYCVNVEWDQACVSIAVSSPSCDCSGGTQCGDPAAGSCCQAGDTPYCSDSSCCNTVCTIDPTCCTIFWSEDCVIWADFYCTELCDGSDGGLFTPPPTKPLPASSFPSTKLKPQAAGLYLKPVDAKVGAEQKPGTLAPVPAG